MGTIPWIIPNLFSGEMVFTPAGDKLALVGYPDIINLFDFDRCTGTISNLIDLSDNYNIEYYGCSFSPNGSKLYTSSFEDLYQLNLSDSDIVGSKTLIWHNPYYGLAHWYSLAQHQITPNGKVFIVIGHGGPIFPDTFINESLCVINAPNEEGAACDFVPLSFYLLGHNADSGLPNSPNYNLGAFEGSPCDTLSIPTLTSKLETPNFNLSPNPASSSFNITYTIHQPATITITNTYGSIVKQLTLHPSFKNRIVYVDDLAEGIYLVTMREGG